MRGNTKLWLEKYKRFLEDRDENDLNINHLNQIIFMHGYTKLHRYRKDLMANVISSINLLVPFRSTVELKDRVSSCAFLTTEDVMEDLSNLEWQECSVQSVERVSLGEGKNALIHDQSVKCASSTVHEVVRKQNTGKRRKVKHVNTLVSTTSSSFLSLGSG